MINSAIRFATLAMFLTALVAAPSVIPARAAGGGGGGGPGEDPTRPSSSAAPAPAPAPGNKATRTIKKKSSKQSLFDDPAFAKGYREAYSTIYDRNDYAGAIAQLKALGHDDFANV